MDVQMTKVRVTSRPACGDFHLPIVQGPAARGVIVLYKMHSG